MAGRIGFTPLFITDPKIQTIPSIPLLVVRLASKPGSRGNGVGGFDLTRLASGSRGPLPLKTHGNSNGGGVRNGDVHCAGARQAAGHFGRGNPAAALSGKATRCPQTSGPIYNSPSAYTERSVTRMPNAPGSKPGWLRSPRSVKKLSINPISLQQMDTVEPGSPGACDHPRSLAPSPFAGPSADSRSTRDRVLRRRRRGAGVSAPRQRLPGHCSRTRGLVWGPLPPADGPTDRPTSEKFSSGEK